MDLTPALTLASPRMPTASVLLPEAQKALLQLLLCRVCKHVHKATTVIADESYLRWCFPTFLCLCFPVRPWVSGGVPGTLSCP